MAVILLLALLYSAKKDSPKSQTAETPCIPESIPVMRIDTTKYGLQIFYPTFSRVDLVCETMPLPSTDSTAVYCCEAAFTGDTLRAFKHTNIAGDHVSSGVRYIGYRCSRNNGAFVYYDGSWKFLHKSYSAELDSAAAHGGMGFGQEMMIHNGEEIPHTRPASSKNLFRALCEIDGKLCIAEARKTGTFGEFISCLIAAGVIEALYLDMGGGWNCSWLRMTLPGKEYYIHPHTHDFTTNWLTFYYEKVLP